MERTKTGRDLNLDLLTRPPLVRSQVPTPWPHPSSIP
jgi:hypothetical protein